MKTHQIKEAFITEYGKEFRFFAAPGRINLIGEHTDYNDGFVMPGAIDKRIYLAIAPIEGSESSITAFDIQQSIEFETLADDLKLPQWARYPYGVIGELRALGHNPGSFHAVFGGDIPSGAGLSSSAALESAFAFALNELFGFGLDRFTLAKVGQKAEHNYVGVKCGIMDQFSSIFGKKNHVFRLDCRSLEYEYFPLILKGYELILVDTQVKHSLASSEYNMRRKDCEEGVMIMAAKMPGVKSLRDVRSKDVYAFRGVMGEQVFLRCEYVTEENERVLSTCDALARGDMQEVGRLLYLSHEGLSKKYDVSCKELDLLVETAKQIEGVMGARMMGGGFGGCTINLVESSAVPVFKEKITQAFVKEFGDAPAFYDVHVGDGVKEIV
jgi:galactokinase